MIGRSRHQGMATGMWAAGFTLFEVLAAIVLLGFLLLGIYAGIRAATGATRRGEQRLARLDQIDAAQRFLRRELAQASTMPIATNDSGENIYFKGDGRSATFAAALPGYLDKHGIQLQQLRLVEVESGGYRLMVGFASLPPDGSTPQPVADEQTLLDGIRDGRLRYLAIDPQTQSAQWSDTWPDGRRLPAAVSIELTLTDGLSWPTMQIPVRTTGIDSIRGQRTLLRRAIR